MGGKSDKNEPVDPYSGKGFSADEMPKDASIPMAYNPLWQPDQNPLLPYTAGAPLLLAPNAPKGPITPFDSYRLNQMVDLVKPSAPQDLEDVGEALWDAARAIKAAERELKTHFDEAEADWEGEAKRAFHEWGINLRKNTVKLSEYAATVGSHLKGAGVGLAMVKASMPERDPGDDKAAQKGSKNLPPHVAPEIDDDSTEEGRKRKELRKEAIAQMTKLSSYYQVALQHIQAAEKDKPTFSAIPDVGVPSAPPGHIRPSPGDASQGVAPESAAVAPHAAGSPASERDAPSAAYVPGSDGTIGRADPIASRPLAEDHLGTSVATDIDSGPPAPVVQPMDPGTPPQMPPTSQPGLPTGGPPPGPGPGPFVPPGGPPLPGRPGPNSGPPRPVVPPTTGRTGAPRPFVPPPTTGRTGPTSPNGPIGRPGRPGPVVGPAVPAQTGQQAANNGTRGLGRPGMMGVPPASTGPNAGARGTRPGAGRATQRGGIVGGTPSNPGSGSRPSGPRAPRGTVIDGQGASAVRRPPGVVPPVSGLGEGSTGTGGGGGSSARKAATNRDGVLGEPSNGASEQDGNSRGFIPGGGGLVVGGQPTTPSSKREKRESERRPGYLSEGERNGSAERRGSVPPVIE
ncbi:hypothetical protein ITI46_19345 [Streptomyces oryzae]|uniref:PPE family domain-containing protein n=1 Tax=Streptomyces oryzae TaxID=1434886 RepID=A0ABS3XEJ5_9ACTN|nr:hypothetical protein [Streptomyces oryzae]MBO8193799.1 hypothetical protein [Streptomyces oryzae]